MPAEEPVGVLVLRIWGEPGDPGLRARITSTIDIVARPPTATSVADREAVVHAVTSFLAQYSAARSDESSTLPRPTPDAIS